MFSRYRRVSGWLVGSLFLLTACERDIVQPLQAAREASAKEAAIAAVRADLVGKAHNDGLRRAFELAARPAIALQAGGVPVSEPDAETRARELRSFLDAVTANIRNSVPSVANAKADIGSRLSSQGVAVFERLLATQEATVGKKGALRDSLRNIRAAVANSSLSGTEKTAFAIGTVLLDSSLTYWNVELVGWLRLATHNSVEPVGAVNEIAGFDSEDEENAQELCNEYPEACTCGLSSGNVQASQSTGLANSQTEVAGDEEECVPWYVWAVAFADGIGGVIYFFQSIDNCGSEANGLDLEGEEWTDHVAECLFWSAFGGALDVSIAAVITAIALIICARYPLVGAMCLDIASKLNRLARGGGS